MADHTRVVQRAKEYLNQVEDFHRLPIGDMRLNKAQMHGIAYGHCEDFARAVIAMDEYKPLDSWPGLKQRIQQLESQLAESRQLFETLRLVAETLEESEKQKAERIAELKTQLATARKLIGQYRQRHSKFLSPMLDSEADQFLKETQG